MTSTKQLREFARVGAAIRLNALAEETKRILAVFPDLRDSKRRQALVKGTTVQAVQEPVAMMDKPKRRRRKLTPAERKNISARMKVYWAERKRRAS